MQGLLHHALHWIKLNTFFWEKTARVCLHLYNLDFYSILFYSILFSLFYSNHPPVFAQGITYDSRTVGEVTRVVIHLHEFYLTHLIQNMQLQQARRVLLWCYVWHTVHQSEDTTQRPSFPYSLYFISYFAHGFRCPCRLYAFVKDALYALYIILWLCWNLHCAVHLYCICIYLRALRCDTSLIQDVLLGVSIIMSIEHLNS